jgi:6-hydroxycyclohex-1-ene-1-carbonyl-CoA dehydrogenase
MVLSGKIDINPFVQTRPMSTIVEAFEEAHSKSPDQRIVLVPDF